MMKIIILKQKIKMKMEEKTKQVIIIKNNILFEQGEGMNIDLNKAMKDCEGIEKVQERTNAGVVRKI